MLTRDILFGMNLLTLAGFAVMGLSLTLRRMAAAGGPLSIGLMLAGTALGISRALCGQRVKVRASRRLSAARP